MASPSLVLSAEAYRAAQQVSEVERERRRGEEYYARTLLYTIYAELGSWTWEAMTDNQRWLKAKELTKKRLSTRTGFRAFDYGGVA